MKKRLLIFLLIFIFMSNLAVNNVKSEDDELYLKYEIGFGDKDKGNIVTENKLDEEGRAIDSFAVDGDKLLLLNSAGSKVLIYNSGAYVKSILVHDKNFLDIYYKDGLIYLYNVDGNVYIYNEEGSLASKEFYGYNTIKGNFFTADKNGKVFINGVSLDKTSLDDNFTYELAPSEKDKSKFIDIKSKKNTVEIPFKYENGGARILGEDKDGNTYLNTKDILLGSRIDKYDNIIYKISQTGSILNKYTIPKEIPYITSYKNIFTDSKGNIFYMVNDINSVKIYKLNIEKKNYLSFLNTSVSAISRKEAQDRAFKMADLKWHYVKSLNGNVISGTTPLPQYTGVTDSYFNGIPYDWGGYDGIDTSSTWRWENFLDAVTNYKAMAGSSYSPWGYTSGTAGIDCSGFVQAVLKIPGSKIGTYSIPNYTHQINYSDLKDMDILLDIASHVLFFQSWIIDENGSKIGANTIESTGGNLDGTGKKVKKYYRTWDDLIKGFTAYRYNNITDDYIESNSFNPVLESPAQGEQVLGDIHFKWSLNPGQTGTAYSIRIYGGQVNTGSTAALGTLQYNITENSAANEKVISADSFLSGDYYWTLEVKNPSGYWSTPKVGKFLIRRDLVPITNNSEIQSIIRLGGNNRYETSGIIAKSFQDKALNAVIIATGNNFPDALAGGALVKKLNAPVVLVNSKVAGSTETLSYINANLSRSGKIYILGGTGAVSDEFINYFVSSGYTRSNIIRIYGANRDKTSVQISKALNPETGTPAVIAVDSTFADALSISGVAGFRGWPILLTGKDKMDTSVIDYIKTLKPSSIYIAGGEGAVSKAVYDKLKSITGYGSDKIVRIAGTNRYETSAKIAGYFYNGSNKIYLAIGNNFPDALSGVSLTGMNAGALMLTSNDTTGLIQNYIEKYGDTKKNLTILGGIAVLPNEIINKIIIKYN